MVLELRRNACIIMTFSPTGNNSFLESISMSKFGKKREFASAIVYSEVMNGPNYNNIFYLRQYCVKLVNLIGHMDVL